MPVFSRFVASSFLASCAQDVGLLENLGAAGSVPVFDKRCKVQCGVLDKELPASCAE